MKIQPRTLKGFRDFLPLDAKRRQFVINKLSSVFEKYGFEPLSTPTIEYEEILTGKYGDEGDKLMYKFIDNGKRSVALRYDQTVPLARVAAQYQNDLPLPFKRYQISNVFRAENTQKGRFREFMQCDIDIIGSKNTSSDAEILKVIIDCLNALDITNFKILVNDRKLFEGLSNKAVIIIDKLSKIGEEKVIEELEKEGYDSQTLLNLKSSKPTPVLGEIIQKTNSERVVFDPTLARGLDYYTGLIIEVVIDDYKGGSIGGGGRYDNLIGIFAGKEIPAVGFAFGFDRLIDALLDLDKLENVTTSDVFVTIPNIESSSLSNAIIEKIRAVTNAEVWLGDNYDLDKQFKYAEKKNIPFIVIPLTDQKIELRTKKISGEVTKEEISVEDLLKRF